MNAAAGRGPQRGRGRPRARGWPRGAQAGHRDRGYGGQNRPQNNGEPNPGAGIGGDRLRGRVIQGAAALNRGQNEEEPIQAAGQRGNRIGAHVVQNRRHNGEAPNPGGDHRGNRDRGRGGQGNEGQNWRDNDQEPDRGAGNRGNRDRGRGGQRGHDANRGRANDRGGRAGPQDVYVPHAPGYRRLEGWLQLDADEVVNVLANTRNGFAELIKNEMRSDLMRLVVALLAKACESDFPVSKTELLACACVDSFQGRLVLFLNTIHTDEAASRRNDFTELFTQLLQFCETAVALLPNTAAERLSGTIAFIGIAMGNVENLHDLVMPQELRVRLERLQDSLKAIMLARSKTAAPRRETALAEQQRVRPPPDDFRKLPVFPNGTQLTANHQPFLRPNIVNGAYQSADHYLDVQFRLLREDFVQPLREGICALMAGDERGGGNVRVYRNVRFTGRALGLVRVGLTVEFPPMKKLNWEHSKRLMFGALLCFSRDNFATLLFGTVLDRKLENLKKGLVAVEMNTPLEDDIIGRQDFTMVEAEVFFPPYLHVLEALQKMPSDDFPMSEYIVDVIPDVEAPLYLRQRPNFEYQITDGDPRQTFSVRPLKDNSWPRTISLNPSQYEAFKAALTRKFVVIQGPPGTGKTHVGLKIARTLLENVPVLLEQKAEVDSSGEEYDWFDMGKSPMLVVCYTNHALDQFLEGLLATTQKIVRVGGRSKSELLAKFNLNELRRSKSWAELHTQTHARLGSTIRKEMSVLLARMRVIQQQLTGLAEYGIVSPRSLTTVCNNQNLDTFADDYGEIDDDFFTDWLLSGEGVAGVVQAPLPIEVDPIPHPAAVPAPVPDAFDQDDSDEEFRDGEGENLFDLEDVDVKEVEIEYAVSLNLMQEELDGLAQTIEDKELEAAANNNTGNQGRANAQIRELRQRRAEVAAQFQTFSNWLNAQQPSTAELDAMEQLLANPVELWDLSAAQRRACYMCWLRLFRRSLNARLDVLEVEYRSGARVLEETRQKADLEILSRAHVVGMTTTMAAKLQPLLMALKANIVIVEEAAEVTESHIVVSLTQHCEHLILIGDHKQLRPSTAWYQMGREFNLDVSLFERMVRNGMHCARLSVQHRMRPEIARLVSPAIYPDLSNHESVERLPHVRGVRNSLFFFTHTNREHEISETSSKRNPFEGDLVLAFCRYLLQQGYEASQVTILATYSGQMFYLKEARNKEYPWLKDVLITIVDNYQGEENDIILLSLVRNNEKNQIGFLSIENRVCVALSRAKEGLFIFGNMDSLVAKGKKIWPKVHDVLKDQDAFGERLPLRCQIHTHQITEIARSEDFNKIPEGGCRLLCNAMLTCGHQCDKQCHLDDRDHSQYSCQKPCTRIPPRCLLAHACPKRCYETCGECLVPVTRALACGHEGTMACNADVDKFICRHKVPALEPPCGHEFKVPCYVPRDRQRCPKECDLRLDCGHSCSLKCHARDDPDHIEYECRMACARTNAGCSEHPCQRKCYETCTECKVQVDKLLPACQHTVKADCCMLPETISCPLACERTLPCDHRCALKCGEDCGDCRVKVRKVLPECQHTVKVECRTQPTAELCESLCRRYLRCGHRCQRLCRLPCANVKDCVFLVTDAIKLVCGHKLSLPCNVLDRALPFDSEELLAQCKAPCESVLRCGHPCPGTCGDCLQGGAHVGCKEACGRELVCGHVCKAGCAEACPPCTSPCAMRCLHSHCGKLCGVPCTPCKMPCARRCFHASCTRRCDEECNVAPCAEPCIKLLRCRHACMGFCGEPCPPLCRECRPDEASEIFFGDEDEPDARFVLLIDCGHSVEAGGMERWLREGGTQVLVPRCPRCKHDIISTQRFKGLVRTALVDIMNIKKKHFGDAAHNDETRKSLLDKLHALRPAMDEVTNGVQERRSQKTIKPNETNNLLALVTEKQLLFNALDEQLLPVHDKRKVHHSQSDLDNIRMKVEMLADVLESLKSLFSLDEGRVAARAARLMRSMRDHVWLSGEEVDSFGMQVRLLQRLKHVVKLSAAVRSVDLKAELDCERALSVLLSFRAYTLEDDARLDRELEALSKKWLDENVIRDMVKAAMGMGRGHWFKCPNGHYYVIGECGGATVEGQCPDCKATIGGAQHRLRTDNAVATDIDGATMSAYDENVYIGRMVL